MGFTKKCIVSQHPKIGRKKRFIFGKSVQNPFFPVQNHNKKKWVFQQNDSQPIFLPSFDIKTEKFWEFSNPNKTVETDKNAWN